MLGDRLPEYEPRVSFPVLWRDVSHVRGILGRDNFYRLLSTLDGAHLGDDLIVRIAHHERLSRRTVVIRPRRSWTSQRDYLRRYLDNGHVRPPRPVTYKAAHAAVRGVEGARPRPIDGPQLHVGSGGEEEPRQDRARQHQDEQDRDDRDAAFVGAKVHADHGAMS